MNLNTIITTRMIKVNRTIPNKKKIKIKYKGHENEEKKDKEQQKCHQCYITPH